MEEKNMKKEYVKPMMEQETMETELPIANSMRVNSSSDSTLDNAEEFLGKSRDAWGFDE